MPELTATLISKREQEHDSRKFFAAMQGVDLSSEEEKKQAPPSFDDIMARVYSRGKAKDSNDILALQGPAAAKAGIGIGNGLEYKAAKSSGSIWG